MKTEIKYTTDGKKVVVVGKLNAQETIVQEVFVNNGNEIPSGENFVVKSLHDIPVISWKEQNLKDIETTYEKKKVVFNEELKRLEKAYYEKTQILRNKLEYAAKVVKELSPESFDTMVMYLTGQVKFIVTGGWNVKLCTMEQFKENYEDKLRLLSWYGKDDGTMTLYIHEYYDSSGHSQHPIYPFSNYEDAFAKFKELLIEEGVNDTSIKVAKEYNIQFPQDKIDAYKKQRIAEITNNIENTSKQIDRWKETIAELEKL